MTANVAWVLHKLENRTGFLFILWGPLAGSMNRICISNLYFVYVKKDMINSSQNKTEREIHKISKNEDHLSRN